VTRACMYCREVYGEKCANCGCDAQDLGNGRWKCVAMLCSLRTFGTGDGGTSHGICRDCEKRPESERLAVHRTMAEFAHPIDGEVEEQDTCEGCNAIMPLGDGGYSADDVRLCDACLNAMAEEVARCGDHTFDDGVCSNCGLVQEVLA
jgi:hypothetical protein